MNPKAIVLYPLHLTAHDDCIVCRCMAIVHINMAILCVRSGIHPLHTVDAFHAGSTPCWPPIIAPFTPISRRAAIYVLWLKYYRN